MNCREFEEYVQEHLGGDHVADASVWSLPAPLIVHAGDCPECARLYSDLRWLLEQAEQLAPPLPRAGFADRVVAQVHRSRKPAEGPVRRRRALGRAGWWSLAAASVAIAMLQLAGWRAAGPTGRPTEPVTVALVSPSASPPAAAETPAPERAPNAIAADDLLPTPAIGKAVLASTANFMNAGKEVGGGIQPITASAIGAFDFLWKDLPDPAGKPSS